MMMMMMMKMKKKMMLIMMMTTTMMMRRWRLKRSNFLQLSRILEKGNPELLDHMPKLIPSVKTTLSWNRTSKIVH